MKKSKFRCERPPPCEQEKTNKLTMKGIKQMNNVYQTEKEPASSSSTPSKITEEYTNKNIVDERSDFVNLQESDDNSIDVSINVPAGVTSSTPVTSGKGKRTKSKPVTIADVKEALRFLGIQLKYNIITGRTEIYGMPPQYSTENATNVLPILLADYFKSQKKSASRAAIDDALVAILDENRYNPVLQMIEEVSYTTGQDYIAELDTILGIENDSQSMMLLRKWLHQTVAMALNDDKDPYGADGVLVLQGNQGAGKTLFFTTLAVSSSLFAEGLSIDLNNKDSIIQSTSVFIGELGELDSTLKREQSSLKAFLTARQDTFRVPYGRTYIQRPRRTSFCATVNPERFLNDETGSRRFWVIHVETIDISTLKSLSKDWLKKMWRQVYEELYKPNPQGFRLSPDERRALEQSNLTYSKPLPGEIDLRDKLDFESDRAHWIWITVSNLISNFDLHGLSAIQVGRVLGKLVNEYPQIKIKYTHGIKRYYLPVY